MNRIILGYHIIDGHTGRVISKVSKAPRALRAAAERRNQSYGSHRYAVHPIFSEPLHEPVKAEPRVFGRR